MSDLGVRPRCLFHSSVDDRSGVVEWAYYLCAFVLFQVVVVLLQQRLGPTFFLPQRVCRSATLGHVQTLTLPYQPVRCHRNIQLSPTITALDFGPRSTRAVAGRLFHLYGSDSSRGSHAATARRCRSTAKSRGKEEL